MVKKLSEAYYSPIDAHPVPAEKIQQFSNSPEQLQIANKIEKNIAKYQKEIATIKAKKIPNKWKDPWDLRYAKDGLKDAEKERDNVAEHNLRVLGFVDLIQKNCSVALKVMQSTNSFLYRGIKYNSNNVPRAFRGTASGIKYNSNNVPWAFRGTARSSRPPTDTRPESQRLFDAYLEAAGFGARRSNSIFCSGSLGQCLGYGLVYMVFPLDGFNFTYSSKYHDLYTNLFSHMLPGPTNFINKFAGSSVDSAPAIKLKEVITRINSVIDQISERLPSRSTLLFFNATHLIDGALFDDIDNPTAGLSKVTKQKINSFISAMNTCLTEMTAHNIQVDKFHSLLTVFVNALKEYVTDFSKYSMKNFITPPPKLANEVIRGLHKFDDKNFAAALKSKHEIIVQGEYYAFAKFTYRDSLSKLLKIRPT